MTGFGRIACLSGLFVLYSVSSLTVYVYACALVLLYTCGTFIRRLAAGHVKVNGEGVVITGCDSGFGYDLARRLDELGFTVFAGCLKPKAAGARRLKSESSERLHVVPLDVGNDDSFEKAHNYVLDNMPKNGIWAIVSNAGFNVMGDVEMLTVNLYQKVMNVNLYGAVRLFRRFLYLVRKSKGRVVVVSSVRGKYHWPADSAYHVTKHGLETLSDSLRLEMLKFGVKVSIVEPGNFSTATACQNSDHFKRYRQEADEMWEHASDDVKSTYGREYLDGMIAKMESSVSDGSATSTDDVIDALVDGITSLRPKTRYLVDGGQYRWDFSATLPRYYGYLPTWLTDWIIICWTMCDTFPAYVKQKTN